MRFFNFNSPVKKFKNNIKNVNVNPTRTGILKILKPMGIKIKTNNERIYKGEKDS